MKEDVESKFLGKPTRVSSLSQLHLAARVELPRFDCLNNAMQVFTEANSDKESYAFSPRNKLILKFHRPHLPQDCTYVIHLRNPAHEQK